MVRLKLGIEGNFFNMIKGFCENPTTIIILNSEDWRLSQDQEQDKHTALDTSFQQCTRGFNGQLGKKMK